MEAATAAAEAAEEAAQAMASAAAKRATAAAEHDVRALEEALQEAEAKTKAAEAAAAQAKAELENRMATLRLLHGSGAGGPSTPGDGEDNNGAEVPEMVPISVATKAYNASYDDGEEGVQYGDDAGVVEIANGKPIDDPPAAALVLQLD